MGLIKSNNAKWQQWQKQQLPWGAQIRIRTLNFVALRHVRGNPLDTKLDPTHLPHAFEAMKLFEQLATDPSVVAIMV